MDAFARAARIAAGIQTETDLAWLAAGFRAWQRAAGALSLERALKLNAPKRGRLAARDALLAELAAAVVPRTGEGAARATLRELRRFERDTWPRWQALTAAPEGARYAERVAFDLFALRVPLPTTPRGLRMRLNGKASADDASGVRHGAQRAA